MQELITIPNENVRTVFVTENGLEPYLKIVRAEIDAFPVLDMSIKKQRDEIKSRVTKITKSKSYLENAGKELAAEMKKEPKLVDASRKLSKETLTAWADEVRKPLTDWENEQQRRKDAAYEIVNSVRDLSVNLSGVDTDLIKRNLKQATAFDADSLDEEFRFYAKQTQSDSIVELTRFLSEREAYEAQQLELEQFRREKEEREEKERLAAVKAAEEKAKADAIEAEEKRIKAAEDKVRADAEVKLLAEKERAEAEANKLKLEAVKAESDRLEAIEASRVAAEQAEAAKIKAKAAAGQAIIDAQKAAEQKIIDYNLAVEAATKKRESNKKYAAKINNAVLDSLMSIEGMTKELGMEVVKKLAKGEINHVSAIQY